jgi:hypothetical protein
MVQGRGETLQTTNKYHNPVFGVKIGTLEKHCPVHSRTQQQTKSYIKHVNSDKELHPICTVEMQAPKQEIFLGNCE